MIVKKKLVFWTCVCAHILFSFIWSHHFFEPTLSYRFNTLVPINTNISASFEMAITYLISRMISVFIIYLIWSLIWKIYTKDIKSKHVTLFGIILLLGGGQSYYYFGLSALE